MLVVGVVAMKDGKGTVEKWDREGKGRGERGGKGRKVVVQMGQGGEGVVALKITQKHKIEVRRQKKREGKK